MKRDRVHVGPSAVGAEVQAYQRYECKLLSDIGDCSLHSSCILRLHLLTFEGLQRYKHSTDEVRAISVLRVLFLFARNAHLFVEFFLFAHDPVGKIPMKQNYANLFDKRTPVTHFEHVLVTRKFGEAMCHAKPAALAEAPVLKRCSSGLPAGQLDARCRRRRRLLKSIRTNYECSSSSILRLRFPCLEVNCP